MTDGTETSATDRSTGTRAEPTTPSGRPTVLIGLTNEENRRLLVEWLPESYEIRIMEGAASIEEPFDVLIVDTDTFQAHRDRLSARKERDEVGLLPYLLVRSGDTSRLHATVWDDVDEVVSVPIRKRKLEVRLEGLLDRRNRVGELARRTKMIEALHGAAQRMDGASEPEAICEIAVDAAHHALGLPLTAIWLADDLGRRLCPVAQTDESREVFERLPTFTAVDDSLAWQTFVEGETSAYADLQADVSRARIHNPETPIQSEVIVPIGEYGVLVSGSTDEHPFDDDDIDGMEILAANTASALGRAEREQDLARKTSQLEFFNSLVRHDVLNGMTVIQARAEALSDGVEDERLRQHVRTVQKWSTNIVDVVQRVKAVVSTVTGESSVECTPVSLTTCLEDGIETIESAYPDATIETRIPAYVTVLADSLVGNVLGNVLKNAVEHNNPADLTLTVSVETDTEYATIRIADDGCGIPDDQKNAVLRRGETGPAKSTGTGFGLFFVDTMVREYGGTVHVEDNEPTGTVVAIELPLAKNA